MKKFSGAVLLILCLLLSGCTMGAGPNPLARRTVDYGLSGAWDSLMPYHSISGSNYARIVYDKLYDRLAYVSADGTLSPRGATSWESTDGGEAVLFHLDEKATFHDGVSVTAQSWVETFRMMTHPDCATLGRGNFSVLSGTDADGVATGKDSVGAEAVDAYTLKLTFKRATTSEDFLNDKNREFYVLPTHLLKEVAPADVMELDLWSAPVGSGPCTFVSELAGSQLILDTNKDYHLGAPGFDRLVMTVMDKSNLLTALIAGDLDYYAFGGNVSVEDAEVAKSSGLSVLEGTVPNTFYELMLNNETIPDAAMRRAIETALDKDLLCEQSTAGLGSPTGTSWPQFDSDVTPVPEPLPADYDGRTYTLVCTSNRAGLAALMQQNLAAAGIAVAIETVDSATMFAGMTDGIYDMGIASHTPGLLPLWFTESRFVASNNIFHVPDVTTYGNYMVQIKAEQDTDKRRERISEFERYLSVERPFIPLWFGRALHVQSPTVTGIDYPSSSFSNENVWDWVKQ